MLTRYLIIAAVAIATKGLYAQSGTMPEPGHGLMAEETAFNSMAVVHDGHVLRIQSPVNAYMIEVISDTGEVRYQERAESFNYVRTTDWPTGDYVILVHTFDGMHQASFKR